MPKITMKGMGPADGEYELELSAGFTNRELHLIKRETGVRAGEIGEAFEAGDNDLVVLLAYIAVQRSGKQVPLDVLWDAPAGQITFEQTDEEKKAQEEAEKLPPPNAPNETQASNEKTTSAGRDSENGGENPANPPSPTGSLPLGAVAD